jgi:hypothetical protein
MLAADKGNRDAKIAERLSGMELSERLSAARLSRCEASLSGTHARQALLALADRAAFLDLPAADLPVMAKPDAAAQREMAQRCCFRAISLVSRDRAYAAGIQP